MILEGLDGPPTVRYTAARLLVDLYLRGHERHDDGDASRLRAKLLSFDGKLGEDELTQEEIDSLKEVIARGEAPS